MPAPPFEATCEISRRHRVDASLALAAGVTALVGPVCGIPLVIRAPNFAVAAFGILVLFAVAAFAAFALFRRWRTPKAIAATLRADARGLFADGELVVARDELRFGYLQPRSAGLPLVRLKHKAAFEDTFVRVRNEEEAANLLTALGLDPSRAVVHFWVRRGIFASNRAQGILSGLIASTSYIFWTVVPSHFRLPGILIYFAIVLSNLVPSRVSIGADGVLLTSLWRRRFYPFSNVASVETTTWGIVLVTRRGERVEIRTRTQASRDKNPRDDATRAIVARVRAGVDALASTETAPDAAALVGRGDRTYEAWVEGLRDLTRDAHYRAAPLHPDALWGVVEDPAAAASARAGAALALRATLDDAGRARLRVASGASASPRIRVALDAVARSETVDAELREALEACAEDGDALRVAEKA